MFEGFDDDVPSIFLVSMGDLCLAHRMSYGHRTMKVIGMSRTETRDGLARLRPRRRVLGVGMRDSADVWKGLIKDQMSRQIRRRSQVAFEHVAVEIGENQVFRL